MCVYVYVQSDEGSLNAAGVRALMKELVQLQQRPLEGVRVLMNEENVADVQAEIAGPAATPYDGGVFRMKLILGSDFPATAPKGYFLTKIFHPNVSTKGEICVNVLKRDWKPDLGIKHVLQVVRCLLIEPFPESALNEEAGKLLLEDYESYAKHAKLMTKIHASASASVTGVTSTTNGGGGVTEAANATTTTNAASTGTHVSGGGSSGTGKKGAEKGSRRRDENDGGDAVNGKAQQLSQQSSNAASGSAATKKDRANALKKDKHKRSLKRL